MKLVNGGIYIAALNPAKQGEIGKVRPVAVIMSDIMLSYEPDLVFVCPISSQSKSAYSPLHIPLRTRGKLESDSFLLIEHFKSIATHRIRSESIGNLTQHEITKVQHMLIDLVGIEL